jgi:hypothetical protein
MFQHRSLVQQLDTGPANPLKYDARLVGAWSLMDNTSTVGAFMLKRRTLVTTAAFLALSCLGLSELSQAAGGRFSVNKTRISSETISSTEASTLDFNEATHLTFMREEEKLARDVYTKLGMLYPGSVVFGRIDDSEQQHTNAVKGIMERHGLKDPNTNDNLGIFTGEEYGDYFTEKYAYLVNKASASELDALYVGAFIEELDMLDINRCPQEIVQQDNEVGSDAECGLLYTDEPDIINLYGSLLNGSESHLRGYVRAIEAIIGKGAYTAQVLSQEAVDAILER